MGADEHRKRGGPLASPAGTAGERAGQELERGETLYRALARNLPNVAVFVFDHDLRVLVAEGEALTKHRLRETNVHGKLLEEVLEQDSYELLAPSWRAALAGERTELDYTLPDASVDFRVTSRPLRDEESGDIWAGLALTHDISDLRRTEHKLRVETEHLARVAQHDTLTGLANRALFGDRVSHALARAVRDRSSLALMFVDIDRFKSFNDGLGHDTGDHVLRETAARLRASVREVDTVARLAGDEFAVLLEGIKLEGDVMASVERIFASFAEPLPLTGPELFVTASVGIALGPADGGSAESLLSAADTAMYRAKAQGGNAHRFYSRGMELRRLERLELESALRSALKRDEFVLHYQPMVGPRSGAVVSVEALIRWCHPERGLVFPGEFIPLAEQSGLIALIGEWVLHRACRQVQAWREEGLPPFRLAVNIARRELRSDISRLVRCVVPETGLLPADLELEITERDLGDDDAIAEAVLADLRRLGVRIAIDDFGTGYSSLSRLQSFPVDTLKVDRMFVQDVEQGGAIALSMVALGHSLGLEVVAEGVETSLQYARLSEAGCDAAAGFLIAPPLPPGDMRQWLLERERSTA